LLHFWGRPFITFTLIAFLSLMTGLIFGALYGLILCGVCLFLVVLYHLRNLRALDTWLVSGDSHNIPNSSGVWQHVFSSLYRQARHQARHEEQLHATLERFRQASSAMPDGMTILGELNVIEWCNTMAENHFDIDGQRDRGLQITHFLRHPDFAEYIKHQNFNDPLVIRAAHKLDRALSLQLIPFDNTHKLLISRDVTQVERVETIRRDFVANVSHELRTPLTVVGGFLETLMEMQKPDPKAVLDYQRMMLEQTKRMQRLVEDLLTLSRLESETNLLRNEKINIQLLLQALYQDALALSQSRHKIYLELLSDTWLMGSDDEIRSAFSNLINNAVRYTQEGGEIYIRWLVRGGRGIFTVQDNGIGIDPQHIPRLTERFYRVDRSRSRETGGTGLGLAIVKHILTRHQATLDIRSEPGKGSRFSAYFPARRLIAAADAEKENNLQVVNQSQK
jgi:two-component system phosphate regulon sensor histidine kinase PhoR